MKQNAEVARSLRESNVSTILDYVMSADDHAILEIFEECGQYEKEYYLSALNNEQQSYVRSVIK